MNKAAQSLGRLGGKAGTGKAKARNVTREQAQHAAHVRWKKSPYWHTPREVNKNSTIKEQNEQQ